VNQRPASFATVGGTCGLPSTGAAAPASRWANDVLSSNSSNAGPRMRSTEATSELCKCEPPGLFPRHVGDDGPVEPVADEENERGRAVLDDIRPRSTRAHLTTAVIPRPGFSTDDQGVPIGIGDGPASSDRGPVIDDIDQHLPDNSRQFRRKNLLGSRHLAYEVRLVRRIDRDTQRIDSKGRHAEPSCRRIPISSARAAGPSAELPIAVARDGMSDRNG